MNYYLRDAWVKGWLIGSIVSAVFCTYHLMGRPNLSHYFERIKPTETAATAAAPAQSVQTDVGGATAVDYNSTTITKTKTPGRWIVDLLGAPDSDTTMFQKALLSANAGDLIILRSGTHTGALLPNRSVTIRGDGTPERPVIIRTTNEPFARIESGEVQLEHLTIEQSGSTEPAIFVHGGKLVLRGVEVKSLSASGVVLEGGSVNAEASTFTAKENGAKVADGTFECTKCKFIHNNNYGLIVNAPHAVTINVADSVFNENGLDGATVGNPGITTFSRCEFRGNQKDGLSSRGEKTTVTLRFSEVLENKYNGVASSGNSRIETQSCKITRNGVTDVKSDRGIAAEPNKETQNVR